MKSWDLSHLSYYCSRIHKRHPQAAFAYEYACAFEYSTAMFMIFVTLDFLVVNMVCHLEYFSSFVCLFICTTKTELLVCSLMYYTMWLYDNVADLYLFKTIFFLCFVFICTSRTYKCIKFNLILFIYYQAIVQWQHEEQWKYTVEHAA